MSSCSSSSSLPSSSLSSPSQGQEKAKRKARAPAHVWTDEETRVFLSLMKGDGDQPGFFSRIKNKRLERSRAMNEVAAQLRKKGVNVTGQQVDNKWKSLLARFRSVEDHNGQSGNGTMQPSPFHEEMSDIMGERASTRPVSCAGTGVPVLHPDCPLSPAPSDAGAGSSYRNSSRILRNSSSTPEIVLPWPAKTAASSPGRTSSRSPPPPPPMYEGDDDEVFLGIPMRPSMEDLSRMSILARRLKTSRMVRTPNQPEGNARGRRRRRVNLVLARL